MKFKLRSWMARSLASHLMLVVALTAASVQAQAPAPSASPAAVLTEDVVVRVLGMEKNQLTPPTGTDEASKAAADRIGKLRTLFTDAIGAFQKGDAPTAEAKFKEAKDLDKSLSSPNVYLARLCFAVNDQNLVKVGRQFLDKAVDQDQGAPEPYMMLGNLALLEGRLADANLLFQQAAALALSPEAPAWTQAQKDTFLKNVYAGRVSVCEQRANWKQGLVEVDAWLALSEKDPVALYRKARLIFMKDPKDTSAVAEARKLFLESYKVADDAVKGKDELPAVPPAELALIELQTGAGNIDEARKEIAEIVKKLTELSANKKEASRVNSTLSQWYLGQGEFNEAQKYAEQASKVDADSPAIKQLTAVLQYFANSPEAKGSFTKLNQEAPEDLFAANYLALVLIESPDETERAKAVRIAELSARLNQKSPVALATLAWTYYKTGKLGEAAQIFAAFEQEKNMQVSADTAYYMAKTYAALPSAQFPQGLTRAKALLEGIVGTKGVFKHRAEAERMLDALRGVTSAPATGNVEVKPTTPVITPPAPVTPATPTTPPATNGGKNE
ncbi:MAG: hypothetical protein K8U03_26335 [Planctomycetia bacterium]|nr:hypothetical protein [Planctomycetia bacterium]